MRHSWVVFALWGAATWAAGTPLDEVVVEGTAARLAGLRQQIVEIEDRFYDLYNELNPVPEFDVHCVQEARVGSLFRHRQCRAVFEDRAFAEEGQAAFQIRQYVQDEFRQGNPAPLMPAGPPVQAIVAIENRRPAFRRNLEEIARRNPDLVRLLKERQELEKQYGATQRKLSGRAIRSDGGR